VAAMRKRRTTRETSLINWKIMIMLMPAIVIWTYYDARQDSQYLEQYLLYLEEKMHNQETSCTRT
jgi:hypothetical protein